MADQGEDASLVAGQDIHELSKDAFQKMGDYLNGELEASVDDYSMLVKMNKITTSKYADMKEVLSSVNVAMQNLNAKYKSLQSYIEQIDEIEAAVNTLEQSAYSIDAYSKQLEAKFKQIERR